MIVTVIDVKGMVLVMVTVFLKSSASLAVIEGIEWISVIVMVSGAGREVAVTTMISVKVTDVKGLPPLWGFPRVVLRGLVN